MDCIQILSSNILYLKIIDQKSVIEIRFNNYICGYYIDIYIYSIFIVRVRREIDDGFDGSGDNIEDSVFTVSHKYLGIQIDGWIDRWIDR